MNCATRHLLPVQPEHGMVLNAIVFLIRDSPAKNIEHWVFSGDITPDLWKVKSGRREPKIFNHGAAMRGECEQNSVS